jgi:hypothetical protein
MMLDLSALDAHMFFKLALGGIKGIPQCHIDIFVRLAVMMFAADYNLFVRKADINADMVEIAVMLVMVFSFYNNMTADDPVTEVFEFGGFFTNPGFHGV